MKIELKPIGIIRSPYKNKEDIPIQAYRSEDVEGEGMKKAIMSFLTVWALVSANLLGLFVLDLGEETKVSADGWGDAPDFTLTDIHGNVFTLSGHLGEVILIDFMATWCSPCQTEMEELNSVYDQLGNRIVMISVDVDPGETEEDIESAFGNYTNKWIFAIDTVTEDVSGKYEIQYIPTIYIICTNGDISYTNVGITEEETLLEEIYKAGLMTVPSAPLNLQANAGDGYVNLTWNAPSFDGDSTIINYSIYRGEALGGETFFTEIENVLYYNDTTVTNGVTYSYKVRAKNSIGEGPLSNEVNAAPSALVVSDSDENGLKDSFLSQYWWISVMIAIVIVILIVSIMLRKRSTPVSKEGEEDEEIDTSGEEPSEEEIEEGTKDSKEVEQSSKELSSTTNSIKEAQLRETAKASREFKAQTIGLSHCSGINAFLYFSKVFGEKVFLNSAGSVIEI